MKIKDYELQIEEYLEALLFDIYNTIGSDNWKEGEPDKRNYEYWYYVEGSYQVLGQDIRFDYRAEQEPADEHYSFCCRLFKGNEEIDDSCGFYTGDIPYIYNILYVLSKWFPIEIYKDIKD